MSVEKIQTKISADPWHSSNVSRITHAKNYAINYGAVKNYDIRHIKIYYIHLLCTEAMISGVARGWSRGSERSPRDHFQKRGAFSSDHFNKVIQKMAPRILLEIDPCTKLKYMKVVKVKTAEKELFLKKFRLFNDRTVVSGLLTTEWKEIEKNRMSLELMCHRCCSVFGKTGITHIHNEYASE